ncbi:MAG: DUF6371 domain-containing protein [Rikenellaceae bacterium]
MRYQLQKYRGRATRHRCPECGKRNCFTLYVDESGSALDERVGRCDHESSCAYHYTPKMYFEDNPSLSSLSSRLSLSPRPSRPSRPTLPSLIPREYVARCEGGRSHFVEFLSTLTDPESLAHIVSDYHLGYTKAKEVIYWQIDSRDRVRTGKVMGYLPDGHRNKASPPNWVHSIMKRQQLLSEDYNLVQCLFGEHLLSKYPTKVVAVVESEKSAVLGSVVFPQYTWVATGGKSQLDRSKMRALEGREVVMFPDVDGYGEWVERSKQLSYARVRVSSLLEREATPEERERKIDIGDWIVEHLQRSKGVSGVSGVLGVSGVSGVSPPTDDTVRYSSVAEGV